MQNQREVTLAGFRSGKFPVLVATDVAARGLDISGVELVVQCEPPKDPETYIHRSDANAVSCVAFAFIVGRILCVSAILMSVCFSFVRAYPACKPCL